MSLEAAPAVGTWEVVEHERCAGSGRLGALTAGGHAAVRDLR